MVAGSLVAIRTTECTVTAAALEPVARAGTAGTGTQPQASHMHLVAFRLW
jgi:hypothetical protein